MATTKFTITLDDEQFDELKQLVAAGQATSVSSFVRKAVETALNDAAGWRQMLEFALAETGGPITAAERKWADGVLGRRQTRSKRRARK
ncbi:MAG: ribbon-helix-helix domain-containing protein [Acidobacteriota bacterium]|nr:ribbon-helix-helix domain-containing protein [Acidobacteriota bacterium]